MVLSGHTGYLSFGGAGGVALFLLVSGYGIHVSVKHIGLSHFWSKRLKAVYLPYLPVAVFNLALHFPCSRDQIIATLLGLSYPNVDSTMWYISYIFCWYAAYYAASLVGGLFRRTELSGTARLVCIIAAALVCRGVTLRIWGVTQYLWVFPLGVCAGVLSEIKVSRRVNELAWSLCLGITTVYLFKMYLMRSDGLYAAMMAVQAVALRKVVQLPPRAERVLSFMGKYSYAIYLFEGMMMFKRGLWFAPLNNQVLIDAVYGISSVLLGYIYWEFFYKKLLGFTRERSSTGLGS